MAPKKRSQTPRHSGVADSSESVLHQSPSTTTLLPDQSSKGCRRRPRDSPRPISSAQSPTQDTVASSRSPIVSDSPRSPVEGPAQGSNSRRESTSTMRTSSISMEAAPSCTPTGRISKAKKGKRVHACEFPGCGKVSILPTGLQKRPPNSTPQDLDPTRPLANSVIRSSPVQSIDGKSDTGPAPYQQHLEFLFSNHEQEARTQS